MLNMASQTMERDVPKENPGAAATASEVKSNSLYPLYTSSHQKTQVRLRNKYGLNRASAIFVADILTGGANG